MYSRALGPYCSSRAGVFRISRGHLHHRAQHHRLAQLVIGVIVSSALVLAPASFGQPMYPSGSFTPRLITASPQSISRSIHLRSPVAM